MVVVVGPTINGYIVEWGGGDYNLVFLVVRGVGLNRVEPVSLGQA
jgi:hypothetical protein